MIDIEWGNLEEFIKIFESKNFPFDSQEEIEHFNGKLTLQKQEYIKEDNQNCAKLCWIIQEIFYIRLKYFNSWQELEQRKYESAWRELVFGEKHLQYLKPHFDYTLDSNKKYYLDEIEERISTLQSLYPYKLFFSPSFTIKKIICSICRNEINPFIKCNHKLREIYGGEICFRYMEGIEFRHIALVPNPRWKLRYLIPKKLSYEYNLLSLLVDRSKDSMDGWVIQPFHMGFKHENFTHFTENDCCPCGSRIKYGDCCLKKDEISVTAYEIRTNSNPLNNHFIAMTFRPIRAENGFPMGNEFSMIIADEESFYID